MTYRSEKICKQAKGRDCMVRIPGVCNYNPETTVTAHNPFGDRGTSIKCPDWDSCWACSACHDVLDGRVHVAAYGPPQRRDYFESGKRRTDAIRWGEGLYLVAGDSKREKKAQTLSKIVKHPGYSR